MNIENYILKLTTAPQYQLESPKNEDEIRNTRKVLSAEIIGKLELTQSSNNENKKVLKMQKCTTNEILENCTLLDIRSPFAWALDIGKRDKNSKQRWKNVILLQNYWLLECSHDILKKKIIADDDTRYYPGVYRVKASELFQSFSTRYPAYYSTPEAAAENCVACVYKKHDFAIEDKKIEFKNVPHPITRYVFIKDETTNRLYGPYRWYFSSGKLVLEAQTGNKKLVPAEFTINIPYYNLKLGQNTYEIASFYGAKLSSCLSDFQERIESNLFSSSIKLDSFSNLIEMLNKDTKSKKKSNRSSRTIGVVNPSGGLIKIANSKNVDNSQINNSMPPKTEPNVSKSRFNPAGSLPDNLKTSALDKNNNNSLDFCQEMPDASILKELDKLADSYIDDESSQDIHQKINKQEQSSNSDSSDADSNSELSNLDVPEHSDMNSNPMQNIKHDVSDNIDQKQAESKPLSQNIDAETLNNNHSNILSQTENNFKEPTAGKTIDSNLELNTRIAHNYPIHHHNKSQRTFDDNWTEPEKHSNPDVSALVKHVYHTIHHEFGNVSFSPTDAANILLCISQNLLTIITGRPGCGKTSFVRQLAKSLGLIHPKFNRFHEVHVGCDWRSQRDLFGYYNPVNEQFEGTSLYRSLKSYEIFENNHLYPYWVFLDDANMSPLEAYLSDFRSIQNSELSSKTEWQIETGASCSQTCRGLKIPSSIRLIAAFCDDFSRYYNMQMIHRAWVISLPEVSGWDSIFTPVVSSCKNSLPVLQTPMDELCLTGIHELGTNDEYGVCGLCYNIYCNIMDILKMLDIKLQKGAWTSIRRYCFAAKKFHLMLNEAAQNSDNEDHIILDYVVSQRILPMIHKSGKTIRNSLKNVQDKYGNFLPNSSDIITDIINRGDLSLFYSFFNRM